MQIKNFFIPFYQDLFVIESFELIEHNHLKNMRVNYRFTGKRKVIMSKTLTEIMDDKKLLNCFSRDNCAELGLWYGRIKELNRVSEHV